MKIQQIKISNFKAIESLESDLKGQNVLITGENGLGKSSVMQLIEIALGKSTNIPPNATGEGLVIATKDGQEYTFHVKFKDGKPQLTITTPDGLRDSRKGVIGSIAGAVDFDIHKFVEQSKSEKGRKEQVEYFKKLLPKEVTDYIDKVEANIKLHYEERAEINRAVKAIKGKLELHPMHGPAAPSIDDVKPVDLTKVYDEANKARDENYKIQNVKQRMDDRTTYIEEKKEAIKRMKEEIKEREAAVKEAENQNQLARKWLAENPEINLQELEQKVKDAEKANETYKLVKEYDTSLTEMKELEDQAGDKTVKIETERQLVLDTIKDMANDSPVQGLSFDADTLYYNGHPVNPDVLSFSEIAELGVRMIIAENPDLPLFISNGESIGNERFNLIKEIAKANDLQIIMEEMVRGQDDLRIEVITE